jgi:secondary thiamine-phosphate synthase enzyme
MTKSGAMTTPPADEPGSIIFGIHGKIIALSLKSFVSLQSRLPSYFSFAMKSQTEYITFNTSRKREYLNITERVAEVVRKSKVQEGLVLVSAMHITAGVWVNDAEEGLLEDIDAWLEHLAPAANYQHHRTGETNGDAHLKNLLVGHQVTLPITAGSLDLGPWQQVYYAEFDGRRAKRLIIKVIGE